jgi:hypothetical protein
LGRNFLCEDAQQHQHHGLGWYQASLLVVQHPLVGLCVERRVIERWVWRCDVTLPSVNLILTLFSSLFSLFFSSVNSALPSSWTSLSSIATPRICWSLLTLRIWQASKCNQWSRTLCAYIFVKPPFLESSNTVSSSSFWFPSVRSYEEVYNVRQMYVSTPQ